MTAEKEEFVLHNRSTDRSTKLISPEVVSLQSVGVSGVQAAVAKEFKHIAVYFISARLRHCIHHARRVLPVLRRPRAAFHLELLQCIRERHRQSHVVVWIVMRCSVQQVHQAVARTTGHRNRGGRIISNARIVGVDTADVRDS